MMLKDLEFTIIYPKYNNYLRDVIIRVERANLRELTPRRLTNLMKMAVTYRVESQLIASTPYFGKVWMTFHGKEIQVECEQIKIYTDYVSIVYLLPRMWIQGKECYGAKSESTIRNFRWDHD